MDIFLAIERSSVMFSNRGENSGLLRRQSVAPRRHSRLSPVQPPVPPASTKPAPRQTPVPNDMIFAHHNTLSLIIHMGNKDPIANYEGPVKKLSKPS